MSRTPDFKQNRSIIDLIADTRKPKLLSEGGWWKIGSAEPYEIPFQNSWANVGGTGIPDAAFYTSEDGEVRFRGRIDGGAAGTTVFNLPVEARPEFLEVWPCSMDGGGTANVGVYPNGDLVVLTFDP